MEIAKFVALMTFLLTACSATSVPINAHETMVSICAIDLSRSQPMPSIGAKVGECSDAVDVEVHDVKSEQVGDWTNLRIAVKPESQAKLEAFLTRNLRKQAVLSSKGRSVFNMFIMSNDAKELQFVLESEKEANELQQSLKR